MTDIEQLANNLGALAMRSHYLCEDPWYSCPLSEDGCADERQEGCTCGANKHNEEVQKILHQINKALHD